MNAEILSPPDQTDTEQTSFSIGELAKQLGVSTPTIRYYEERGLINPQRSNGNQRIYTRRDRGRIKLILRAKAAGFDLEESKEVLDLYDTMPSDQVEHAQAEKLEKIIIRRVAELNSKINKMTELRDELVEHLATLRNKST